MIGADSLAVLLEQQLPPSFRVVVAVNFATPGTLLGVVNRALPTYRLFALNAQPGLPDRDGVTHVTPFVGPGVRWSLRLEYVPARLSLVPRLFASTHLPDLVLLHTTPCRNGLVSLGIEVNVLPAAVEQARRAAGLAVAQINPRMPWTYGEAEIVVDLIDLGLHVDAPLASPAVREPSVVARTIGDRIAGLVPADCSTIVPALDGPVTSFQHSWVVTEHGAAAVWPCSASEQADHLIQVAHPDARPELERSRACLVST